MIFAIQWDISIVEFFNNLTNNDFLKYLFLGITYLGNEYVFIVLIGTTYWAINKKAAKDVGIAAFYAMMFNGLFKGFFNRLRPFQESPSTITCRDNSILATNNLGEYYYVDGPNGQYLASSSTSFPSGHAQGASATYNSFAKVIKKKWGWIVANILCLLVMISRMALGVHYLTDVLAGWAIGFVIIMLVFYLRKKVKKEIYLHIVLLSAFGITTFLSPLWSDAPKDLFTMWGVSAGLILGMFFEEKKVNFSHTKSIWKNILRVVIGLAIVLILKIGLKPLFYLFCDEGTYLSYVFDLLRYFIMTFVGVGIYPLLIKKCKFLNDSKDCLSGGKNEIS